MKTADSTELSVVKPESRVMEQVAPSPIEMMQAMIKGGVTASNVAAFEKLAELQWKFEARDAEKAFANAFVQLQRDLPTITAKSIIPNRGKYEKFEDVMAQIQPMLTKHGFTVAFSMDFKENRIIETCHLTFGGVTRSNSFAVRAGKADSDTQADCKAATTAKRNALLNALNIVIRQDILNSDDDAAIEGDPNAKITPEQADELEHRAQLTNSNIPKFLLLAGAAKFSEIPARNYDMLSRLLSDKERGK